MPWRPPNGNSPNRPQPNRCANCYSACRSLFCNLECAEERYSIVMEAIVSMEEVLLGRRKR